METSFTIRHRLRCAVRAIDTTTGYVLPAHTLRAYCGQSELHPLRKTDGYLVFLDEGRQIETILLKTEGFLPHTFEVVNRAENDKPLVRDVQMIPNVNDLEGAYITIEGKVPGLFGIDAVSQTHMGCIASGFDKRKMTLSIYNPHCLGLDNVFYAIVEPSKRRYEAIEITKVLSNTELALAAPLQKEVANKFSLVRRVFGKVEADGTFLLRLKRTSGGARWIVRYSTKEGEQFETVDYSAAESRGREPPR